MHDIYFFNGQDITMNVCIQIHRVINLIQKQEILVLKKQQASFIILKHIKHLLKLKTVYGQKMRNIF